MDKNFRRALYTALVAGGLVVVGATAAYAAADAPRDAIAQGAPEATQGAAATGGASVAAGVDDEDLAGALVRGDVAGVVDGTLGADGLVHGILDGLLPSGAEEPGAEPGTDEPGVEQPGTDEPGTDPGTDGPDAGEPGEQPGTDEPGTEPGTDGPGILDPILDPDAGEPGVDPGTDEPGSENPGSENPGHDTPGSHGPATGAPGAEGRPGRGGLATGPRPERGTALPEGLAPGSTYPGERPGAAAGVLGAVGVVAGSAAEAVTPGADDAPEAGSDAGPASEPVADDGTPDGGVDISWGDKAVVVPTTNDGAILSGGLSEGLLDGTPTGLDGQVTPVSAPGETLAQTGPMITGQLALVSLLLGLGLVALRSRRRRIVV